MNQKFILEENVSFADSLLWKLQKNAYDKGGPRAWEITNNPFIAYAYAHLIRAFLRDFQDNLDPQDKLDPKEPLYILDLGAGAGRFSYLLLKTLLPLLPFPQKICLVLTDNVESYLPFWNSHPQLQRYFQEGTLDFAQFNPVEETSCHLIKSGKTLSPQTLKNPLIAIANYFFAALPNTLYRFDAEKNLYEGKVTLRNEKGDLKALQDDPSLMNGVEVTFSYDLLEKNMLQKGHIEEEIQILNNYRVNPLLVNHPFLIPHASLRAIGNLNTLANGKLALIASDKCRMTIQELSSLNDHRPIVTHVGDINVDVNADAISQYTSLLGGEVISSVAPHPTDYLEVPFSHFTLVFGANHLSHSQDLYFALFSGSFPPLECHKLIRKALSGEDAFSMDLILSLIQMSHFDPQLLHFYAALSGEQLTLLAKEDSKKVQLHAMHKIWEHFFWISKKDNELGYTLAQLFYYLKHFAMAREILRLLIDLSGERSGELSSESDQFFYFMGLCYEAEGNSKLAYNAYNQTVVLNPEHAQARKKLRKS